MLDIILIILGVLCLMTGLMGCVLPFLPGPPVAYLGLIFLHFTDKVQYSTTQLIVWLLIVVVIQILDYFTPCSAVNIVAAVNGVTGAVSLGRLLAFFSCHGELFSVRFWGQ